MALDSRPIAGTTDELRSIITRFYPGLRLVVAVMHFCEICDERGSACLLNRLSEGSELEWVSGRFQDRNPRNSPAAPIFWER